MHTQDNIYKCNVQYLQDVRAYRSIPAVLMAPCLCTLNIPKIAITSTPADIARKCVPTPTSNPNTVMQHALIISNT